MKNLLVVTAFLLILVLTGATACNPFGNSEEANQQLVEVMRGDLTVTVNGIGNIAIHEERTLFFGTDGRVDEVYVDEGDKVGKGDVLAKLDTNKLELAVTQARVDLNEREVAVAEAQITLETAEYNLEKTQDLYTWSDIRIAESDVDEAERYLEDVLSKLVKYPPGSDGAAFWQKTVVHAQARLNAAKDKLEAMLTGTDPAEVVIKELEVELAEQALEQARLYRGLAQQSLELAERQLKEATLIAPFSGEVASVYIDEEEWVLANTAIFHLVDLNSLELKVEVDEIDILGVELGQEAIVSIDALPGVELGGKVTFIPPEAKEKTGLILYDVEISFDIPQDLVLRGGMSATADIVIEEHSNVLLVPNQAITLDSQGNPTVTVIANEQMTERKVVTGISDGSQTEILSGLDEGGVVVVIIER